MNYLNKTKFNFPKNCKKLKIDIGTGPTAPNAAFWINSCKNTAVLLFEADHKNYKNLITGKDTDFYNDEYKLVGLSKIILNGKIVKKKINAARIKSFNFAVSNYTGNKKFYYCNESLKGNSSLLKPKRKLGYEFLKSKVVRVEKLKKILKKINFKQFKYISFLKIDTQGNDLNVLKSAGIYLNKVLFIQTEYCTEGQYYGEINQKNQLKSFENFLKKYNFRLYYFTKVDAYFVNLNFYKYIIKNNITDECIEFKNGLFRKSLIFNRPIKLLFKIKIIFFLRQFQLFNFIFYKVFKINFKKFL